LFLFPPILKAFFANSQAGYLLLENFLKCNEPNSSKDNASNEVCNLAFRNGKIKFSQIEEIINKVMSLHKVVAKPTFMRI